jgi:hypothetical protein
MNCVARADASPPSERAGRLSVCDLLTRRGRTPLALAFCAGSRFRETNREFVQSNECEGLTRAANALAADASVSEERLWRMLFTLEDEASGALEMWRNTQ